MKLWLIERVDDVDYDEHAGFVIRAETEADARQIAADVAAAPLQREWRREKFLNPDLSTCTELAADGEPGVILRDFKAG